VVDASAWEQHADWWQREFTDGADPEYEEQILPMAAAALAGADDVLDVGCGEGQVARLAAGSRVVGVDPAWAQISVARERAGGPAYAQAAAAALPFPATSFDAVVACLVFEHITDVDTAISEVARVLRPGGRFLFFLNHPLLQTPGSGWIDDQLLDPPESTGGSAPTSSRTSPSRRWRRTSTSRSSTGRCTVTSTPWPPTG
jgi:SAM-dependent methyltransferase